MSQFVDVLTSFNAHQLTLEFFGVCDSFASRPDRSDETPIFKISK